MAAVLTRTEQVQAAVSAELARRRAEIDADGRLRRLELIVKFSERTGAPYLVLYRIESHSGVNGIDAHG